MSGQVSVTVGSMLPQTVGSGKRLSRLLRRLRPRAIGYRRLVAKALIFLVTLTVVTGSVFQGSADTAPSGKVSKAAYQAPPATGPACTTGAQISDAASFAQCPSFFQDFANQASGPLSTQDFNFYTGNPGVNQEAELYTSDSQNVRIEKGNLVLEALNNPQQGYKYTSARIDTNGKEDFQYGKLVIRATLPDGVGSWPAIWMLPSEQKYASLSPATDFTRYLNDGEIDIAESVGAQPHVVDGIAHSLAYPPDGPNRGYYSQVTVPDNDRVFHNYELDWTPTNLTFKVDGQAFFSINKQPGADYHSWPYDQPFYLVMNLALGGTWGGIDKSQFPPDGVDRNSLPESMNIQSINYYPYIGE